MDKLLGHKQVIWQEQDRKFAVAWEQRQRQATERAAERAAA